MRLHDVMTTVTRIPSGARIQPSRNSPVKSAAFASRSARRHIPPCPLTPIRKGTKKSSEVGTRPKVQYVPKSRPKGTRKSPDKHLQNDGGRDSKREPASGPKGIHPAAPGSANRQAAAAGSALHRCTRHRCMLPIQRIAAPCRCLSHVACRYAVLRDAAAR